MITKTYTELNAELTSINANVEALNMQLAELTNQKDELTIQIQLRQQQLWDDYTVRGNQIEKLKNELIILINQQLETQKELMEMGFDPTTNDTTKGERLMSDSVMEVEQEVLDTPMEVDTPVEVGHVETSVEDEIVEAPVEEHKEEIIEYMEETINPISVEDYCSSINISKDELDEIISSSKKSKQLPTPYYYVWGLRKGEFDLICSTPNYKNTIHKLQTSFMKLTQSPNETMLLGNEKYRDSYPNPDEGRVFSAYGISPTLTRMHSNILVEIGNPPHVDTAA